MVDQPSEGVGPFLARRLQDSAGLRTRVEAARTLGISYKRFEGWEPTETTEHEYDETGRLVRSVTTREVEWDEQEQAWMLALAEQEALTCTGCNGWLPETILLENDGSYRPPKPIRCHSCDALAIGQKARGDKERPQVQRWPIPQRKPGGDR